MKSAPEVRRREACFQGILYGIQKIFKNHFMKKKLIFWVVVAVVIIALGIYLKYTSFGVTVVTVLVGLGGIVAGWLAKMLYDRYVKE